MLLSMLSSVLLAVDTREEFGQSMEIFFHFSLGIFITQCYTEIIFFSFDLLDTVNYLELFFSVFLRVNTTWLYILTIKFGFI
jgi:hypothetical protein